MIQMISKCCYYFVVIMMTIFSIGWVGIFWMSEGGGRFIASLLIGPFGLLCWGWLKKSPWAFVLLFLMFLTMVVNHCSSHPEKQATDIDSRVLRVYWAGLYLLLIGILGSTHFYFSKKASSLL